MFTGIIEAQSEIIEIKSEGTNIVFWLSSPLLSTYSIDQSIAHNGICLTIDDIKTNFYRVSAIEETVHKTTISRWEIGQYINTERCLTLEKRLDGHIVQGHIEAIGTCINHKEHSGSVTFTFQYPIEFAKYIIEKGSICVDGISLTCHNLIDNTFQVSIIPYTLDHTNAKYWKKNCEINLEFDIIGKYLYRNLELSKGLV